MGRWESGFSYKEFAYELGPPTWSWLSEAVRKVFLLEEIVCKKAGAEIAGGSTRQNNAGYWVKAVNAEL